MSRFLERVEAKIGTSTNHLAIQINMATKLGPFVLYEDDYKSPFSLYDIEKDIIKDSSNKVNKQPHYDRLIHAEVTL